MQRRLLNPASAMFREGGLLLREEPSITDPTSYASVLAAISAGSRRRSEVAAALGRPSGAIAHLLTGLQDIGLIDHLADALRGKRSVFRITEPVVRLHQLITGRYEPELVAGRAARVWTRSADTVASKIYGRTSRIWPGPGAWNTRRRRQPAGFQAASCRPNCPAGSIRAATSSTSW